jgi:hypothetical protein
MELTKPVLKITSAQSHGKKMHGLAIVSYDRPYIVMAHLSTREPAYQLVAMLKAETQH